MIKRNAPSPLFSLLCGSFFVASLLAAPNTAEAIPFDPDVTATGFVLPGQISGPFGDGQTSQSGISSSVLGGVLTNLACPDRCDTFDNSPGTEGLFGTLTDLGDGFGYTGNINGSVGQGETQSNAYQGVQFDISVTNNSATDSFLITFGVVYDDEGTVSQGQFDSASNFLLALTEKGGGIEEEFETNNGGSSLIPFTGSGATSLSLLLAPGQSGNLGGIHDASGQVFGPAGFFSITTDSFWSIDNVERLSSPDPGPGPANPIPEPATMLLFGSGLAGLAAARRRKK